MANNSDHGCIKVIVESGQGGEQDGMPLPQVLVQLFRGDERIARRRTRRDGEVCFDGLDLDANYSVVLPFRLDQDKDGYPEFEFSRFGNEGTESIAMDPDISEVSAAVTVNATGSCKENNCAEVSVFYRLLPISLALDVVEDLRSIRTSIDDLASYSPTSEEVTSPAARAGGVSPVGAEAPLQRIVDSALMEVLGRRLKTDDSQAFLASLTRAFVPEKVNGRTVYKWTPRSYAVQTELGGAITGAQASLYRRARTAFEEARPLIDGLEPLSPSADLEDVEAVRAIVRTEFAELVDELGLEGGPRIQRVEDIFRVLDDQLDEFEQTFGLVSNNVNTVDEEQNLTNFLIIKDYITGLEATWNAFRAEFTDTKFLGSQLVLLSRALSSVAESVDETYRVMDSVRLGPAERQTVLITFPDESEPLLVEELLSWVARFATEEGPMLIQDGGRRGVDTIEEIADLLRRLVEGASQADVDHVGFSRERVRRSLKELASQLARVVRLAAEVKLQESAEEPA